jgi:L-seryl-tRNA(Ser) seleniumtransferase
VNKEEMLGMMVALEMYLKRDHAAEWKEWERRVKRIADSIAGIPTVTTETWMPDIADHVPHLRIRWDQSRIKLTPLEAMEQLRTGTPSIEACPATNSQHLVIGVWMMQPGDAEIVARRVAALLKSQA